MMESLEMAVRRAVRALGVRETSRRLGLSSEATLGIAAGAPSQPGTIALAEQRRAELDAPPPDRGSPRTLAKRG